MSDFSQAQEAALAGGPQRHHEKTAEQGKLPVRERVEALVDPASFIEEARSRTGSRRDLEPTGSSPASAMIDGRRVALMANDPTVKAGSWGPKTVEKILRVQERALELAGPDPLPGRLRRSADHRPGADVPGRRGAGRIFYNEVRLSGQVPQVCLLLGPSAAGGAYIPAFCDVVIMREGNASMYLGSPRMAEMVIGETVTLGGDGRRKDAHRRLGLRPLPGQRRRGGDRAGQRYLSFMPGNWRGQTPPAAAPAEPASERGDRRDHPGRREPAL